MYFRVPACDCVSTRLLYTYGENLKL